MAETVGRERKDEPRDDRRTGTPRQVPRQREHADARCGQGAEHHQVMDQHRSQTGSEKRRRDEPFDQHRVRVSEDVPLGMELIGVEQVRWRREQRMLHPGETPDVEEDIEMVDRARCKDPRHRPRHHTGQQDKEGGDREPAQPRSGGIRLGRIYVTNHSRQCSHDSRGFAAEVDDD